MIKVENLYKSLQGHEVLKGISFEIPKGETVALLGSSGSGKSTLLRCLNLLEKPDQGTIEILGEIITSPSFKIAKLRTEVGMVFQHFHLFPHMTLLENVMYAPIKVRKLSRFEAEEKARALLKRVGLEEKALIYPRRLSGGQKQRAAIARALCMDPQILLFDEPTSALDPEMAQEVLEVIKGLAHTGMTILIVTHVMSFAKDIADRIFFLDQGRILEETSAKDFFSRPQTERAQNFLKNY